MLKHSRSLHEISNNPQNLAINDYSKYHYHSKKSKIYKKDYITTIQIILQILRIMLVHL